MPLATVTLSTTTFAATVEPGDSKVILASAAGITPFATSPTGTYLYADRELMQVERATGIGTEYVVKRGMHGTVATRHASNVAVYLGRPDQFYDSDPKGLPPAVMLVYPYINIHTGVAWIAQGDEVGPGNAARIWAPITITEAAGALGVTTVTTTIPTT